MSSARDGNVLIGALLERLGTAQSQALLARLDRWLVTSAHPDTNGLDHDQVPAAHGPYDRRKQDGNGN